MRISNRTVLLFILCISAILRFYKFADIPFMHDEFSAIFRTDFNTFQELIEKGVKPDGHPAGIQVFLFYWIKLFGRTEWVVKLPFAAMGVASVLLIYLIAKKWYNETVGLISAAFLASIQYTVMYSQIARPYISGLFFSLLMVYFWTSLMNSPNKQFWKNGLLYVLASALCAYNHHFSLLFAAIVGLSGIFIIPREFLFRYMSLGVLIVVFYIPHLNIFFFQFKTGGVGGWLSKPENTFFHDYLYYLFNYSLVSIFLVIAIVLFGLVRNKKPHLNIRNSILFLFWFLLPLLIGFWYSIKINPVLQFSVLIFSFYPLLFLLFGHISNQNIKVNTILVLAILSVNISSLIIGRKHYSIFYNSPYEKIVINYSKVVNLYSKIIPVIDSHKKITRYYLEKYDVDSAFIWFDSFNNEAEFIKFLREKSTTNHYLYLGALSSVKPNTIPIIRDYFPVIQNQKNYYGGSTFLFSNSGEADRKYVTTYDFTSPVPEGWHSVITENIIDSIGYDDTYSYLMDSLMEWSPTYSALVSELISHENSFIDISVTTKTGNEISEALLIATLESEGEVFSFSGADFNSFIGPAKAPDKWTTVHHSLKFADINLDLSNLWLKVFVWNKGKSNFIIDNFRIEVRNGNPIIYSLYEKIP